MSQEKRVVLFTLVVLMIMYAFTLTQEPPQRRPDGDGADVSATTDTATVDPGAGVRPDRPAPAPAGLEDWMSEGRGDDPALDEPGEVVTVRTDVFEVDFDTRGARPNRWDIIAPEYLEKQPGGGDDQVISMIPAHLRNDPLRDLPLELNLKLFNRRSLPAVNRILYDHEVTSDADGVTMARFVSREAIRDVRITKTFTFHPGSFLVDLVVQVDNLSSGPCVVQSDDQGLGLSWGPGIGQYDPDISPRISGVSYVSAAAALPDQVRGITPKDDGAVQIAGPIRWVAMQNKTFMAALIAADPDRPLAGAEGQNRRINALPREIEKGQSPPYTIIASTAPMEIAPNSSGSADFKIFVGPMKRSLLRESEYGLQKITFYSSWTWFRSIMLAMMYLLDVLYAWCHSYGLAIILLTVIVKILTYPLTHHSMKLNAKTQMEMGRIKPELDQINAKYKDDFNARNKATMEAYKKHNINPMAPLRGCVPLLIQFPILIALYRLLDVSVELRGESFFWIQDLSQPDRLFSLGFTVPLLGWSYFNLLPFLMAGTTVLTQLLSATQISDPNQKMMMYMMPIMLLFMLYNLSAGLFVYWITGNIWQAAHQYITTRLLKKHQPPAPALATPTPSRGGRKGKK